MSKQLRHIFLLLSFLIASFASNKARATHLYGADLGYTYVSGNTYKVTLTLYANCAGSAYPTLIGSTAQIDVRNGTTLITTLTLPQESAPVEVTPVCAAQAGQTACFITTSTIPGVKRFIYSINYTVPSLSANWRFLFTGSAGGSTGRSNDIGNITTGSTLELESTLNNLTGSNSSPAYTTIPTPFFCVNKEASYNPGTIDPDGDSLTFALVPGIGVGAYILPYTATAPLAAATGTFSFSNTTGQLDFTPSITQKSLVVSQVAEYRSGILVGTSMREMTFVALPCLNNPPGGDISAPSTGITVINETTVSVCKEKGPFTYKIDPTDADGNTINVIVTGLPAGATFNVTGNNTTAPSATFSWNVANVAPGNYNYFVTYTDNGCPLASKQTIAYTITVLPNPKLTFSLISPATCVAKAIFTVTPANADNPYVISFGPATRAGVTGAITDSLASGTYTFSVTALNGCTHDTSITIASPSLASIAALVTQNTCNATTNGSVVLTASNSTGPYTFAVGPAPYTLTPLFGNLAAGTYVFHVKDLTQCIKDTTITISDSLKVQSSVAVTDLLCNGTATGRVLALGSGAVSPYQYALNTGAFGTGGTFNSLAAGTYTVHVKDNLGCFKDTVASLVQPTKVTVSASVTNILCNGQSTGAVALSATGGVPSYTYAVGAGAYSSAAGFSGLAAGNYTFHVKDNNGCQIDTTPVIIAQPARLAYVLAVTNVLCNGGSTGTITVNAAGGTPAYTYAADGNALTAANALTRLNAGAHLIHLKDNNGCLKDSSVTITQPAVLSMSYTSADPACFGSTNGTITIAGSGGTTPYSFALNAGAFGTSGAMNGLAPGTYAVHLRDANNCTHDTVATLVEPARMIVTATVKRPRCTPLVNGEVALAGAGGNPGYTYAVGTRSYTTSPVITNLGSGTYVFHVKDAKGCVKDTSITLTDSVAVHAVTAIDPARCFGSADGKIAINPSGGDAPYTFALNASPYTVTNPLQNLTAATYALHIKDANGCVLDTSQTVVQPTVILPAVTITRPLCFAGTDGVIVMAASGGTPNYTFANGTGTFVAISSFSGLAAGTYTMHVKDANGCVRDTTITVGQPTKLQITSLFLSHNFCNGDSSGFVKAFATGAIPPYTFAVDAKPFGTINTLSPLKAGLRVIHVKDAQGCVLDSTILLNEPTKVYLQIDSLINPTCEGFKDGAVKLKGATGGNPAYTFSADKSTYSTQLRYTGFAEGSYTFYTKDNFGCVADTTVQLKGYPHININGATVTNATCFGDKDAAFTLLASGGNPSFTYYLNQRADSNQTGSFHSLAMGTYVVHIKDATGCVKDTTVQVTQPDSLQVSAAVTPNDCVGYDNGGAVNITATGGTEPYAYTWSNGQTGAQLTGIANGAYTVIVADAHHCQDSVVAVVTYDNCCRPYIVNAFTPNGDGRNDKFHVVFKGDMKLLDLSVYNRFGQRVYNTSSPDLGWDGTWNNVPQDLGTYFYYIRLICGNHTDEVQEFKGDITLIR